MQYNLVGFEGSQNLTIVIDGEMHVVDDGHPSFSAILSGVLAGDESVVDLIDVAQAIATQVADEKLSERMRAAHGRILFDNDPLPSVVEDTILRYLRDGNRDDLVPLVGFIEKLMTNPNEHSREQSYPWIANQSFSLTEDGDILAYKGVNYNEETDVYRSTYAGGAIVNGENVSGYVEQRLGDVVEMPRSSVVHDPSVSCSVGLHVGTKSYARGFGSRQILVSINPRDFVSVPNGEGEKMRVSRYTVVDDVTDEQEQRPIVEQDEQEVCSYCGDVNCEYPVDSF